MPSCATTTPCSPRTAPPPSPSASTTAPSTTCAPTSVEWPTARRSRDCGPRRHDVLDHPGPERALVRHAALPPRRRPVADLRPHAHSQPRPRVVLHPGRVRRALRAPRHRQLRARHRGRGRPGGRARRGDGALRAAPASPARRAAPGAHDLRNSIDRRRRVAVDLGRHAHPASQARGPVVVGALRRDDLPVVPALRDRRRHRRGAGAVDLPGADEAGRDDPRRHRRRRDRARNRHQRLAPVHGRLRAGRRPRRARRDHRRAARRRLSRRRLRDPAARLRRRHHRRPRQPQGRAVRRLAGGPARHVRQGPVPRPRDVHDLRADGHHPRAAAHGTLRRAMTRGLALVAAVLLIALPWGLSSYQLGLLTKMLIFAVFAMSLNLILGYAGLPSLGHAAYFGVAAYTTALLSLRLTPNFWLDFAAGLIAAAITAALFGLLALRAQGSYLLMITLALAQVLWGIAFGWKSFTGGDDGLPGIPRPSVGLPWSLTGSLRFYYFALVVFVLATAFLWLVVHSPFGHALVGIRESERRMEVLGYNTWAHKYVAFILAGTLAGVAGMVFVYFNGFVSPAYLSVVFSAMALIMVILGGAGTLLGPAIGSAVIVGLESTISAYTQRWILVLGLIYVGVTLFAP